MEGFLTFVFVVVILVWLMARFLPLILAWWVKRRIDKMSNDMKGFSRNRQRNVHKEGDVIVDVEKKDKKIVDDSVGEYVDYEETKQ
jgi:uncharacterized protein YoxC